MFTLQQKADFSKIPVSQNFHLRFLAGMSARLEHASKRPQLNLGLVLDRSGSMQGEKLSYVKSAVSNLIQRLASDDIYSLTIFDHEVDMLIPAGAAGSMPDYSSVIDGITSRGNTNLSSGYQKGYELACRNKTEDNISRVILLTDGLANEGVTNPNILARMAESFKSNGVTTSTIGVGSHYDELLMGSMAHSGGGNTYFIENPDDAPGVFQEEMGYLLSVAATDVSVSFTPKIEGLTIAQLNNYKRNDTGTFEIGDLYSGQEKFLLVEMAVPAQSTLGSIELAEIKVSYRDVSKDGLPLETRMETVKIIVVGAEEFSTVKADHEVTLKAALLFAADTKSQMIKLANERRFEEAAALADRAISMLQGLGISDPKLEEEIRDLMARARGLRERGQDYYTAQEKKRMYYESDMVMQSKLGSYENLKSRRKD